ncbi:MAG: hypothetical protein PHC64_02155 [Candidatus Gastranaerophilales bacterium]|nr:hypothetical protein [Candidatus Gastranaerophilales bacterium]
MSYRYDSYLVIANKFGSASSDAKAQLFETYDQLRDITVSSASGSSGSGFEASGGFLYNLASLFAPSAFATSLSGNSTYSIPGTSYYSSGALSSSTYGMENYSGFAAPLQGYATGQAASILTGYGSETGGASSIGGIADIANAASYTAGTASAFSGWGQSLLLQSAGLISGIGGIMQGAAPYMGEYGLGAIIVGNIMNGSGSAVIAAIQNAAGRVTANADVVLSNKVRNIETVCKMLDTQGDVVKKMLKESIDSDSKAIQNL